MVVDPGKCIFFIVHHSLKNLLQYVYEITHLRTRLVAFVVWGNICGELRKCLKIIICSFCERKLRLCFLFSRSVKISNTILYFREKTLICLDGTLSLSSYTEFTNASWFFPFPSLSFVLLYSINLFYFMGLFFIVILLFFSFIVFLICVCSREKKYTLMNPFFFYRVSICFM